jgi:acetoin utilization protein AcuB
MRASTTMTRNVIVVPPGMTLVRAWELMAEHKIRHLPVVENGRLAGMLSDRDILLRSTPLPSGQPQVDPGLVRDAMAITVLTCGADSPVSALAMTMIDHKIDALPVIDGDRAIIGLVTHTDLLWLLVDMGEPVRLPFEFKIQMEQAAA